MKQIRVLDQYTANRIAAGEVVERPASVVKEFVENALDAGAKTIAIETENGGLALIRVTDDGSGIPAEDTETAFLRHATSKISTTEDLFHIETLGFRGEALASIAAVSRTTLRTKTADAVSGVMVRVEGGDVAERAEAGLPEGTSMECADLFYNVPARLKFIKSPRAESAYISDYVSRMIMARPDVAFHLIQNNKTVYQSGGDGSLKNAVYCVYGSSVLPHLRAVSYEDGYLALSGFIGTEQIGRANRTAQSFYVNGRYIKSQKLSFALQRVFDTRLMTGRFPFGVINICINAGEIDVNVHPNKLDVRFRQEDRMIGALISACRRALADDNGLFTGEQSATYAYRECIPETNISPKDDLVENIPEKPAKTPHNRTEIDAFGQTADKLRLESLPSSAFAAHPVKEGIVIREGGGLGVYPRESSPMTAPAPQEERNATPPDTGCEFLDPGEGERQLSLDLTDASIIGQIFQCYWIVQQEDAVFFIDQHAAHERRLYERIMKNGVNSDAQMLLVPMVVKLAPIEFDTLMENLSQFEELGFGIEEFGPLTVSIRSVPTILGAPQTERFLHEAIAQLDKRNRLTGAEMKRAALITAACKAAVKAGEKLNQKEVEALLQQYAEEGIPMTCPHGRPVMVKMTKLELEKLFKRVL